MKIGFASTDWSRTVKDEHGHPVWGGAGWVRLGQYQHRLEHDVVVGTLAWSGTDDAKGEFGVMTWDKELVYGFDVIVMQRYMFGDLPEKMRVAQANGQVIVNDLDDWYWGLSPANGAFAASHPKVNERENTNHYRKVLAASSLVTVSTPYLADRVRAFVNSPIEIVPNHVDVARFTPRVQEDVPVVGWVGSTGHRSGDLEILQGVLSQLRGKVRFHHSGHIPGARPFAEAVGLDPDEVSTSPLVAPQEYPSALCFDIGLAPLTDNPFNRAKSWIKPAEYSAAGIPFVGSSLDEYERLRKEYGIGRTAKRPVDWVKHLNALLDARFTEGHEIRSKIDALDIRFGVKLMNDLYSGLR